MDEMFRNCVISPSAVATKGIMAFDEKGDFATAEALIKQIESFLRGEITDQVEALKNEIRVGHGG
jgi:hypothetical protein